MNSLPWTYDVRADMGTTNVRLGMWLVLSSEAMFFAWLVSAYVLLRTGAAAWPDAAVFGCWAQPATRTAVLAAATASPAGADDREAASATLPPGGAR